jgi:hypothetical protein
MSKKILSFEDAKMRDFVKKKAIQHNLPPQEVQTIVDDCYSFGEIDILDPEDMEYLSMRVATHAVFYHSERYF